MRLILASIFLVDYVAGLIDNYQHTRQKGLETVKSIRAFLWLIVVLALAGWAYISLMTEPRDTVTKTQGSGPAIQFSLTDHTGKAFSSASLEGRYRLMYFGYTFCPDFCPMDLAKMSRALQILQDGGDDLQWIQPLFITIDPERDTVAAMAETMDLYHPHFLGLTGSVADVDKVKTDFNFYARKAPLEGTDDYLMDHFVGIFLYDHKGRFITVFSQEEGPEAIADALKKLKAAL